jgi:alcohol dehydrogenase
MKGKQMLPTTMLAARLHAIGAPMVVERMDVPRRRPGDAWVKVQAASVIPNFHGILAKWDEQNTRMLLPPFPAVFGINAVGVVEEVDTEGLHIKVGDRVYVNAGIGCGVCERCQKGVDNECADFVLAGYCGFGGQSRERFERYPLGAWAEYVVAPERNLVKIPNNVKSDEAVRMGYLAASLSAIKCLSLGPESVLVIDGATGRMGLSAVLVALALNVGHVLATGRRKNLLHRLKGLAPERIDIWSLDDGSAGPWIRDHTAGRGADAAANCMGRGSSAQSVLNTIESLRSGGSFVNIGGTNGDLHLNMFRLMTSQLRIFGNNWFPTMRAREIADLAQIGRLDLSIFEQKRWALADINVALEPNRDASGGFSNLVLTVN